MPDHENQAKTPTEEDHVIECIKAIDDYRGQNISKWEAVTQILSSIRSATPSMDIDQRVTAGGTYLAMLDEHDQTLINAGSWGRQGLEQNNNENNEQEEDADGEIGSKHSQFSRSCSPSAKRPKFSESLYAWKVQEQIPPTALLLNLEHTRTMVQNYTADLKNALWSLQSAGSLPPFPKSEWKHVLSGAAVNLDVVFSGLFSTLADDKTTTSVGDFDLSVSTSKPSKIVQTHRDWTIAWNATSAAILCAFPHRAFELRQYSKYILQFFRAFPYSHSKVINLDKAIRQYTREVKHIELSKIGRFRHLEARYLQEDGAGNRTNSRKEKEVNKPSRRSNETCRQWNNGICNHRASECCYRHLCAICRGSHPSSECTKKD
jgi:hypothetical protein